MLTVAELRTGNTILLKQSGRIKKVQCTAEHLILLSGERAKDIYPVILKPEIFLQLGFSENKKYTLLPQAREFVLTMPVIGNSHNEIRGYMKSNGECFCRAVVNDLVVSNNIFTLHALQNLYYALTGQELPDPMSS